LQGETPSETGIFHESETLSETLVGAQKPNKIRHILKSVPLRLTPSQVRRLAVPMRPSHFPRVYRTRG
jgi:hypothetical protein